MAIQGISFSGIASGLDTEAIIAQLLAIERNPIVKLKQQEDVINARKSGYDEVRSKLQAFRNAVAGLRDIDIFQEKQTVAVTDEKLVGASRTDVAAAGGYDIVVTSLARAEQLRANGSFTRASADDVLRIRVGSGEEVEVQVKAGDGLEQIASTINSTAGIDVYASVVGGQLYLSSKKTGTSNTITVSSDGTLADELDFSVHQTAANATFTVNGVSYERESNIVEDVIVGVKLTLKASGAAAVTVSEPSLDANAIADNIDAFVKAYNEVLQTINAKVTEERVRDPQTSSERSRGALFQDSTLVSLASNLRSWVSHAIAGAPEHANEFFDIGVKVRAAGTQDKEGARMGLLTFDRERFLEAFEQDPSAVKQFFTNATEDPDTEGISQYLERQLQGYLRSDGIFSALTESQDSKLRLLRDRQDRMEAHVRAYEQQLRRQFTQLESALSGLQNQGLALSGQLALLFAN